MDENSFIASNNSWHKNNVAGLYITDYQLEVLKKNNINLKNSINAILMEINDILEDEENTELELVASQIDEMNYYKSKKN